MRLLIPRPAKTSEASKGLAVAADVSKRSDEDAAQIVVWYKDLILRRVAKKCDFSIFVSPNVNGHFACHEGQLFPGDAFSLLVESDDFEKPARHEIDGCSVFFEVSFAQAKLEQPKIGHAELLLVAEP